MTRVRIALVATIVALAAVSATSGAWALDGYHVVSDHYVGAYYYVP
jgi:hypothetical protein